MWRCPKCFDRIAAGLLGIGIGLSFSAMANLIVENVRREQTGVATGMNAVTRTLGGAFGGQLAATLLASNLGARGLQLRRGRSGASQADDLMAGTQQLGDHGGADMARSTSNEYTHGKTSKSGRCRWPQEAPKNTRCQLLT